jgi:aminopeptidase N
MVHALTHAFLRSAKQAPPAWLDEGVARFMGTLWLEKQGGRTKALESLEADRQALALAEPSSPGESAGQPLRQAIAPAYYRTKAAYVLWMLRDIAGDTALSAALRAYDPAADQNGSGAPGEFETLLERNAHLDLKWFFADWVDADKGLPDLAIDSVFPTAAQAGNTLVGVNLSNAGYAAAEVPVTVRTAEASVTQRVLVPGRGKVVQRILIQGTPTAVQINDGTIPETEASEHVTDLTGAGDSSSFSGQSGPPQ